jgi:hypothetical protein
MKKTGNLLLEIDKMVLDAVNNGAKLLLPTENLFPKSIVEAGIGGRSPIILFCFVDKNFYLTSKSFDYPLDRFVAVSYGNTLEDLLSCSKHVSIETLRVELQNRATSLDSVVEEHAFNLMKSFKKTSQSDDDDNKKRMRILEMIPLSDERNFKYPYNEDIRKKFIEHFTNYFLDECADEFYEALRWYYNNAETKNSFLTGLTLEMLKNEKSWDLFFCKIGYPIGDFVIEGILMDLFETRDDVCNFLNKFINYHKRKGSTPTFNAFNFSIFVDYLSVYFSDDKYYLDLFKKNQFKITLDFCLKNHYDKEDDFIYEKITEYNNNIDVGLWTDFIEEGILEIKNLSEELTLLSERKVDYFYGRIIGDFIKELSRKDIVNYYIFLKIYKGLNKLVNKDDTLTEKLIDKKNLNILRKKVKTIKSILSGLEDLETNNFI